jgi:hypothetical protein
MAVDEQAFLHHALTIDGARVRVIELAPCGDPDCDCAERPNGIFYFAKPDARFDEWLYFLEADVGFVEEADAMAEDVIGSIEIATGNLCVLSALVGAPWSIVREDPGRVVAAQKRTSRLLGRGGCEELRQMGSSKVREMFGLAHELWREVIEEDPR